MSRIISEIYRLGLIRNTETEYWNKKIKGKKVSNAIISLSILPSRLKGFKPTLNSLTDQTVLPEKIVINLPTSFLRDDAVCEIPDFISNHPLVYINEIEKDLGPATKLLPTLTKYKNDPNKLIIVLDDDQVYPKGLVENYVKFNKQLPNAALTISGWTVPNSFNHDDRIQIYGAIVRVYRKDTSIDQPVQVDCLQGAASFAVMPKLFNSEVFDYSNAPKEAFFVDDIWFSGNLSKSNSEVYVIPAPFRFGRFVSLRQPTKVGLSKTVNKGNKNNNILYEHFVNDWWSLNK